VRLPGQAFSEFADLSTSLSRTYHNPSKKSLDKVAAVAFISLNFKTLKLTPYFKLYYMYYILLFLVVVFEQIDRAKSAGLTKFEVGLPAKGLLNILSG